MITVTTIAFTHQSSYVVSSADPAPASRCSDRCVIYENLPEPHPDLPQHRAHMRTHALPWDTACSLQALSLPCSLNTEDTDGGLASVFQRVFASRRMKHGPDRASRQDGAACRVPPTLVHVIRPNSLFWRCC